MNVPTKIAGFVLGLGAIFGLAVAIGAQVGAVDGAEPSHDAIGSDYHDVGHDHHAHVGDAAALTLGADLAVPGRPDLATMPVSRSDTVAGELVAGEHSMLTLTVSKDGEPVTEAGRSPSR